MDCFQSEELQALEILQVVEELQALDGERVVEV